MLKFKSANPMEEILDLIRMNNPLLAKVPAAAITPKTITPITGNKNTRITLFGDGNFGLIGQVELEYDRVDIGKIFNQFVDVNKTPTIRIFGNPGSTTTIVNLLSQVNAALGTSFIMGSVLPDLVDQTITYPNKAAFIDVTITAPAGGLSARVLPGSTLKVRFSNNGFKISSAVVTRKAASFLNADGTLRNTILTYNPATLRSLPMFKLKLLDFTSILNKLPTEIFTSVLIGWNTRSCYNRWLTTTAFNSINAQLVANGIPPMVTNAKLPTDYSGDTSGSFADGVWINTPTNNPTLIAQRQSELSFLPTSTSTSPLVNKMFSHYMVLPIARYGQTTNAAMQTHDYYLHFNM